LSYEPKSFLDPSVSSCSILASTFVIHSVGAGGVEPLSHGARFTAASTSRGTRQRPQQMRCAHALRYTVRIPVPCQTPKSIEAARLSSAASSSPFRVVD